MDAERFVELEQVVATRERELGQDHPDTLAARHDLALSYYHFSLDNGGERLPDAIRTMEITAQGRARVLGEAHPDTLATWTSLSLLYQGANVPEHQIREPGLGRRIIAGWEEVVAQRERRLGPDEPDTQFARIQLASAYMLAGRRQDERALREQVLLSWGRLAAERTQRLGPVHPDTVYARDRHAYSHRWVDGGDEQVSLVEQIVADHVRLLGPDHPRTLRVQVGLVSRYFEGNHDIPQAIALGERVIDKVWAALGPDDDDTRTLRAALFLAYQTSDRTEEAFALIARYPLPGDDEEE